MMALFKRCLIPQANKVFQTAAIFAGFLLMFMSRESVFQFFSIWVRAKKLIVLRQSIKKRKRNVGVSFFF
jgi:hypothetical protein